MQVTIPDEAAEFVERLSESMGYRSVGDYVNSLILDDSQRVDEELAQAGDADFFEPVPTPEFRRTSAIGHERGR